jgi:hypothetical protein
MCVVLGVQISSLSLQRGVHLKNASEVHDETTLSKRWCDPVFDACPRSTGVIAMLQPPRGGSSRSRGTNLDEPGGRWVNLKLTFRNQLQSNYRTIDYFPRAGLSLYWSYR